MDLSIVIVNWNTKDLLIDCIHSIIDETKGIEYEIIVVDNGSTDGSASMLKELFPSVVTIENSKNFGFAAANNQGISVSRGKYVLLLNSDTVVLENALVKMVELANQRPEAGVIGCRVLNQDRTLQPTCFMNPSLLSLMFSSTYIYKLFPYKHFFSAEKKCWLLRDKEREVHVIKGCIMLFRSEALRDVDGMDESYFMYCEETDICYRLAEQGWKIIFTPVAKIIHYGGASSKMMKPEMTMQLRASILLFFRKHHHPLEYWLACLLVSAFFIFRVPFWILMAFLRRGELRKQAYQTARTYWEACFRALRGWQGLAFKIRGDS